MTFSTFRTVAALVALTFAAACMDPQPRAEDCTQAEACLVSQIMAAELQSDVGTDVGGGVILRNVQAAGSLVVIDLSLPIPAAPLEDVQKRLVHTAASQSFTTGFCSNPDSEEVFQFGNAYQLRSFGNDGVLIGASTLRSCGG